MFQSFQFTLFSKNTFELNIAILGRLHEFYLCSKDDSEIVLSALNSLEQNETLKKIAIELSFTIDEDELQQLKKNVCKRIIYLNQSYISDIKAFSHRFPSLAKIRIQMRDLIRFLPHLASFTCMTHVEVAYFSDSYIMEQARLVAINVCDADQKSLPQSESIRQLELFFEIDCKVFNGWSDLFQCMLLPSLSHVMPRLQKIQAMITLTGHFENFDADDMFANIVDYIRPMKQQCHELYLMEIIIHSHDDFHEVKFFKL